MKEMLQKLREASVAAILQADDITALENLRVKYLGKKGHGHRGDRKGLR